MLRAQTGRRGAIGLLALAAVAALGLTAVEASAKKKPKKKPKHPNITQVSAAGTTGAVFSTTTVTASCPPGTRVVGGGFAASPPTPTGPVPSVYESRAVLPSAWQVRALETGSPGGAVNAYAFCEKPRKPKKQKKGKKKRKKVAPLVEVSAAGAVAGSATGSAQATCPGKLTALSGGFSHPPPSSAGSTFVSESRRVGTNGWRASGFALGGPSSSITSYAYCGTGTRTESAATTTVAPAPNSIGSALSAPCAGGSKLAAVGFSEPIVLGTPSSGLSIHEAAPIDQLTARVSGRQLGSTATPVTAAGYCA
jgi:hypothetical protein